MYSELYRFVCTFRSVRVCNIFQLAVSSLLFLNFFTLLCLVLCSETAFNAHTGWSKRYSRTIQIIGIMVFIFNRLLSHHYRLNMSKVESGLLNHPVHPVALFTCWQFRLAFYFVKFFSFFYFWILCLHSHFIHTHKIQLIFRYFLYHIAIVKLFCIII